MKTNLLPPSSRFLVNAFGALALALLLAGGRPAEAQTSLSLTAGSLGGGLELTQSFTPFLDGRLGFHGASLTQNDRRVADVHYDATAKARTGTAFLDLHPFAGGFRLTGGLVYNGSQIDGTSLPPPGGTFRIGGIDVPSSQVGRLDGRVDFKTIAPYLGLGWGGPLAANGRVAFAFDLGAFYQGSPQVHLTPVLTPGSPIDTPAGRALLALAVAEEERRAEADLSSYKYYPVVSVGLSYRF
jgi:hypothetical protein